MPSALSCKVFSGWSHYQLRVSLTPPLRECLLQLNGIRAAYLGMQGMNLSAF